MNRKLTPWERLDGVKHSLNLTNVALDSIIEDAVEWERSRIIKLLEAECERPLDPKWEHYRETCSCAQIALIKGEQK